MAYDDIINAEAQRNQVDPDLVRSMVLQESRGVPTAVSPKGASGLMQLMPATAKDLGVSNIFDPKQNIAGGTKYLRQLIDKYGNVEHAVMAYNMGPGAFDQYQAGQRELPKETAQYGDKVSANFANLKKGIMPQENAANVDAWLGKGNAPTGGVQSADAWLGAGAAQPVAAQAAPQQAPAQRTAFDETARQVGLTGRAAVTGLTSLPTMLGDAANSLINFGIGGVNRVAGTNIPQLQMPSEVTQRALNAVGVPQPQNATERVVQDVASAMAGTGGQYRLGQALMKAPAAAAPVAAGLGRALTTAPVAQIAGAAGGAAAQGAARENGAGLGGQLTAGLLGSAIPVVGASLATSAVRRMQAPTKFAPITPEQAPDAAANAAKEIARETGTKASTVNTADLAAALTRNPTADPKALVRQQDFQALGMDGTLGQITRDPAQYARERNIRGAQGVGEPMLSRFAGENNRLQELLNGLRGEPMEPYQAGQVLSNALSSADEGLRQQVTAAYQAARQSTGKDLNVPLQGVAQKYAETLKNFGDKVPSGVQQNFNELGLLSGNQRKVFTMEDADNLSKVINANYSNDPATNKALGQLNQAIKDAVLSADAKGGPFAPAVKLAKARFDLQDAIPALKDAAEGKTSADDFVKRFVANGKIDEVRGMADLLKKTAPDAFKEARNQLGNELNRAAFGANVTGDKLFSPERYAEAVRRIGTAKLGAFFTPDEVADIQRIGRVGAYINSFPSAAPVSTSNSGVVVENLLRRVPNALEHAPVPGAKLIGAALRTATKGMEERQFVENALKADLGKAGNRMTKEQAELASKLRLQPAVRVPAVKP